MIEILDLLSQTVSSMARGLEVGSAMDWLRGLSKPKGNEQAGRPQVARENAPPGG